MKVQAKSTTVTRYYTVTDAPAVKRAYTDTHIIPQEVTATFVDGVWNRTGFEGPRAKKDGSPGNNWSEGWFGTYDADKMPDWMRPFTNFDYTPEG